MTTDALFPQALRSDLGRDVYAPTMELIIDGTKADAELAARCVEVSVTLGRGVPGSFSLSLSDPGLESIGMPTGPGRGGGPMRRGAKVSVRLGYGGRATPVLTGLVRSVSADFQENGPPLVRVEGYDALHSLTQQERQATYVGDQTDSGMSDSSVVAQVADRHHLQVDAPRTDPRTRPRVQANITDFQFLQQIAAGCDRDLFVDPDGVLRFSPATDDTTPALRLTWGRNLKSFSVRRSDIGQVDRVEVRGWNPTTKDVVVGQAPASAEGGQGRVLVVDHADVSSSVEAAEMAKALFEERARAGFAADGAVPGDPDLVVGRRVDVSGVGEFDGTYVLTTVTHRFSASGFDSTFEAERLRTGAGSRGRALGSAGEHPVGPARTIPGVLPGVVVDAEDPAGHARVRVRLSVLGDDVMIWARIATALAGPQRGLLLVPRVDDEVLVAFEQGDPARAYVVGSLWGGHDAPPEVDHPVAEVALLRTTSGHRIELVDSSGSRKVSLLDSEGNGLVIDTEAGTVSLTASKEISFKVPQGTLTIEASEVYIAVQGDLNLETAGGQTLKASGNVTIRGATVRIN